MFQSRTRMLERAGWSNARTLTDLGELTARWLEGSIRVLPGYGGRRGCGPDQETRPLIRTLAAANRRGYVTCQSQPGYDGLAYDGRPAQQRAAVEGFADPEIARWLTRQARAAGLLVVQTMATRRRQIDYRTAVTVSQWDGKVHTEFGATLTRSHLRWVYQELPDEALDAITSAIQVTLIDPEWGRQDVLWRVLERMPAPRRRAA